MMILTTHNPTLSMMNSFLCPGVISTTGRLDRESQSQYSLEVQVSDGGDPLLSSTSRVLIDVTDVNDHSPVFLEQYYSIRVPAGRKNRVQIKVNIF